MLLLYTFLHCCIQLLQYIPVISALRLQQLPEQCPLRLHVVFAVYGVVAAALRNFRGVELPSR